MKWPSGTPPGLSFVDHQNEALQGADALPIVTEWPEFRNPDFDVIMAKLKQPLILDGRNLYDPALVQAFGIDYVGGGRGPHQRPRRISGFEPDAAFAGCSPSCAECKNAASAVFRSEDKD